MEIKKNSHFIVSIFGGGFGNVVEWYSFMSYAYLTPVLSKLFFPKSSFQNSIILVYFVFAAGFLGRPLGAIFFGYLGDKVGRKKTLVISQALMTLPSLLLCFLPTYEIAGILAPILLCLLRFMQGFSIAGEYTTSLCYMAEIAPPKRKGFFVSSIPCSTALGILFSTAITLWLINYFDAKQTLYTVGWRACFFIGFALSLMATIIRFFMKESEKFLNSQKQSHSINWQKIKVAFQQPELKTSILVVLFFVCIFAYTYQFLYIWCPNLFQLTLHQSRDFALNLNSISMICFALFIVIGGISSDILGKRKVILASLGCLIVFLPLAFYAVVQTNQTLIITIFLLISSVFFGLFVGSASSFFSEAYPLKLRSTFLSLSYNIPYAIVGGLTPAALSFLEGRTSFSTISILTGALLIFVFLLGWKAKNKFIAQD